MSESKNINESSSRQEIINSIADMVYSAELFECRQFDFDGFLSVVDIPNLLKIHAMCLEKLEIY